MKENIITGILLILGIINTGFIFFGYDGFLGEGSKEGLYESLSLAYDAIVGIWAYWKNHSFTKGHITADSIAKALNSGASLSEYLSCITEDKE